MAAIIAFPSPAVRRGSAPGTVVVLVYGRRAYRTAAALYREEGVSPDLAEPFEAPADASYVWRVWPDGPVTSTSIKALALSGQGETVLRVPISG